MTNGVDAGRSGDILFVEGAATLEMARARGFLTQHARVVAVTSRGMAACEEQGIPYKRLDSWTPPDAIANLGWRNYRGLSDLCTTVDDACARQNTEIRKRGIRPLRFSYFQTKICMDAISTKILELAYLLAAEPIGRLIYSVAPPSKNIDRPGIPTETNLVAEALDSLDLGGWFGRVRLPFASPKKQRRSRFRKIARRALRNWKGFRRSCRKGQAFILFDPGHDIEDVLPALMEHMLSPRYPREMVGKSRASVGQEWLSCLKDNLAFRGLFEVDGIGYFNLMEKYLFEPLSDELPRATAAFDAVAAQVARKPVAFALTGTVNVGLVERSQMLAAQQQGAPLITFQEGAGYGSIITPIYDYTEMVDGDLMLTYGPGNAEYYAENDLPTKPLVAVGSPHQEKLRARVKTATAADRPFTVIYVGTVVEPNNMHCPNNGLVDTYYFSQQMRIFDALTGLPENVRILARIHPRDRASETLLALSRYDRIIHEKRPFGDILSEADVFVMDFPSTVLLSACLTDADLLVLASPGVTGFTESQARRLRTRAELYTDIEAFCDAVATLSPNARRPRLRGDDYLRAYSLPDTEDTAIGKAVALLGDVARSGRLPPA